MAAPVSDFYPVKFIQVLRLMMKTVLVVEDSLTDRQFLSGYLQDAGLVVVNAASVEEAQEKLSAQTPDIIFLDVILPGASGFEFCRELKTNPETTKIPVVICSTKNTDVDKMWGNMLGANAYLTKPVNPDEVNRTLQQLIG